MSGGVNRFYNTIDGVEKLRSTDLIDLFSYYLTVELREEFVTPNTINRCFAECDLTPPANTSAALSKGLSSYRGSPPKYVKVNGGYRLHRNLRDQLSFKLGVSKAVIQTSIELRRLETMFSAGGEKSFLTETIDCFEVGANRAAIIMCWILALDHLCEYVFQNHLTSFNVELAKVTDKRVKVTEIRVRDDFSDIPENKFIELLRGSGVISNDVRKILDEKLGIRNSCAHPSGVIIKASKVVGFIEDLIENVVLKYKI